MNPEDEAIADEITRLVASACDAPLSPEDDQRLATLLHQSEEARRLWTEFARLHVQLHVYSASERVLQKSNDSIDDLMLAATAPPDPAGATRPLARVASPQRVAEDRPSRLRHARWVALAACLMIAFAYWSRFDQPPQVEGGPEIPPFPRTYAERSLPNAVAVLTGQAGCVWRHDSPLPEGSPLPPGSLHLVEGNAQVELVSGVQLVLQGPVKFSIRDSMMVVCESGRIRASVPEAAHGFVIETPTHRAIDLGTEFAVDVKSQSETEIHVITGEVEVEPVSKPDSWVAATRLTTGQAIRSEVDGAFRRIPADGQRFLDARSLQSLHRERQQRRVQTWALAEVDFRQREDLIAYYGFQGHEEWSRLLRQDGPHVSGRLNGAIVGCGWAEGRFVGRRSLEFKGTEDRVRLRIPGEYDSLSFNAWVRIDGLDRVFNSLLMTVGHDLGEPHWQINNRGDLVLGVKGRPDDDTGPPYNKKGRPILNNNYEAPGVIGPNDLGSWIQVTSVLDAQRREVRHYRNGERVWAGPLVRRVKMRLGECEIGNWTPIGDTHHWVRALNGRIDELAVLSTALTDDEVRALYLASRP